MVKRRRGLTLSDVALVVLAAIAIWFVNATKWDAGTSPNQPYAGQLPLLILVGLAALIIGKWFQKR